MSMNGKGGNGTKLLWVLFSAVITVSIAMAAWDRSSVETELELAVSSRTAQAERITRNEEGVKAVRDSLVRIEGKLDRLLVRP